MYTRAFTNWHIDLERKYSKVDKMAFLVNLLLPREMAKAAILILEKTKLL